jgi:hypothetical protein
MFHTNRVWCVSAVESVNELVRLLTESTWTLCSAWVIRGHPDYLWLNDALSENGALEIAVIKGGLTAAEHWQIESLTVSWMTRDRAIAIFTAVVHGEYDDSDFIHRVTPSLQTPDQHGHCCHCA